MRPSIQRIFNKDNKGDLSIVVSTGLDPKAAAWEDFDLSKNQASEAYLSFMTAY